MFKFLLRFIILLSILTCPFWGHSQLKFKKEVFIYNNEKLPYNILKTSSLNKNTAGTKYPIVLFLHGAGERGKDNVKQVYHIKKLFENKINQEKYPCFVLAPQCPENKRWVEVDWSAKRHTTPAQESWAISKTMALLHSIIKKYPIDTNRIYVTGLSMGGYGTWDIISRYPNMFAAAIPICGGGDEDMADVIKHIPIWNFHGSIDNVVPVERSRNMISAIIAVGGNPKYTEYEGVKHGSWIRAYKEKGLLEWLFSKNKTSTF